MPGSYEHLRRTDEGAVATVELARPETRNALSAGLIEEIRRCFGELAEDGRMRAVVLAGEGRSFCAGAEIGYMRDTAGFSYEENVEDARRLAAMFGAVEACPKPVVARVQGAAIGGGAGLAAAADVAVAEEGARFAFSEVRLGIAPAVIAPSVVRRIGAGWAQALFLTGERFGAGRACEIGLVHEAVPAEDLDATVGEKVVGLLQGGPAAQAAIKEIVREAGESEEVTERMARRIAELRTGEEGQEGLSAFLEKREPGWREGS